MRVYQRLPNGTYYLRAEIHGVQIYQSLKTKVKAVAEDRAKRICGAATERKFDAVRATQTRNGVATLGRIEEIYRREAAARRLNPSTVQMNLTCLKRLCKPLGAFHDVRTNELSRQLVQDFAKGCFEDVDDANPEAVTARKRTVKGYLRKAKSVFTQWAIEEYKAAGLVLPDLDGFLNAEGVSSKGIAKQYIRPVESQVRLVLDGIQDVKADRPELYAVFLLVYPLALRAREAASARVDWLEQWQGSWRIRVPVSMDFMTKSGRDRFVPVHDSVAKELLAMADDGFLLPGQTFTDRYSLVTRYFSNWMHGIGWERLHCAHELRALMGCRWFTEQGAEIAQQLLGHKSVATTCAHYAHYSKQVQALAPDW